MDPGKLSERQQQVNKAVSRARYVAWASARIVASGRWEAVDAHGHKEKMPKPEKAVQGPRVVILDHALTPCGPDGLGIHCVRCHRKALGAGAKRQLLAEACRPTALAQFRALTAASVSTVSASKEGVLEAPSAWGAVRVALPAAGNDEEMCKDDPAAFDDERMQGGPGVAAGSEEGGDRKEGGEGSERSVAGLPTSTCQHPAVRPDLRHDENEVMDSPSPNDVGTAWVRVSRARHSSPDHPCAARPHKAARVELPGGAHSEPEGLDGALTRLVRYVYTISI